MIYGGGMSHRDICQRSASHEYCVRKTKYPPLYWTLARPARVWDMQERTRHDVLFPLLMATRQKLSSQRVPMGWKLTYRQGTHLLERLVPLAGEQAWR
jgi:hypothetical protein